MKKWKQLFIMIIILLLFTGCNGSKPEEELFTIYERAAEVEQDFAAYGQKIAELEQNEEDLYKQIIQDGKKSNQNIQSKIEEVLESIAERKKLIEKQMEMLSTAHEETAEAKNFIKKIEDKTVREKAQRVQELYDKRYEAFITLEENYQLTIQLEKQLYADLKAETQDLKDLESEVSKLNEGYSRNASFQKAFSDVSSQLNDAKKEFYNIIGIFMEK